MTWLRFKDFRIDQSLISRNTVIPEELTFIQQVLTLIRKWNSGQEIFDIKTSGSTGIPRKILFNRDQLIASARQTGDFFKLKEGETLFCCLPLDHVAGFMMIIRGLVLKMNIYLSKPSGNPLTESDLSVKSDFGAFTNLQMIRMLEEKPEKLFFLNEMKAIIIGGGKTTQRLSELLVPVTTPVYETFGMTETLTHIALKRLNGDQPEDFFRLLPGITARTDQRSCLVIRSEVSKGLEIITNDIVSLNNDGTFKWLGRYDLVVNSGGIKLQLDRIEDKICAVFHEKMLNLQFFLFKNEDEILGERLEMAIEKDNNFPIKPDEIKDILLKKLESVEIPKRIYILPTFKRTSLGKTDRLNTIRSIYKEDA